MTTPPTALADGLTLARRLLRDGGRCDLGGQYHPVSAESIATALRALDEVEADATRWRVHVALLAWRRVIQDREVPLDGKIA